ncbi:MAG: DnaJ C-terminal domain-containing protein [Metamycoplasmataceae bacterium]
MSKSKRDYYEILGLSKDASEQEIKTAYRKLAKIYHPDKNKNDDDDIKFKEINEAYEILSNPQKRKAYDTYGHNEPSFGNSGFGGGGGNPFGGFGPDVDSIFSQIFGGGWGGGQASHKRKKVGPDYSSKITISFIQSILGYELNEDFEKFITCNTCDGSGAESKSDLQICKSCDGKGKKIEVISTFFGKQKVERECSSCEGEGKTILKKCRTCKGKTYLGEKTKLKVKIPQGIISGQTLIIKGYGGPGLNGNPAGDLHLKVLVKEHKYFRRVDNNIFLNMPISISDIICENKIKVPTPYGPVEAKMSSTYKNNDIITIKNKGVTHGKSVGDLKVIINFYIPKMSLSEIREISRVLSSVHDLTNDGFNKVVENNK